MSKKYNIAVIPGDGTGPEVIREGIKVLEAAGGRSGLSFNFKELILRELYKKTGETCLIQP